VPESTKKDKLKTDLNVNGFERETAVKIPNQI
jgi:hypothetical protein